MSSSTDERSSRTQRRAAGLLLLVSGILILPTLGIASLRDHDEALYAAVARDVAARGHWLSLTVDGEYYSHKPPLMFWLMAISYRIFGQNEFAARLPSALFGIAGILITYMIGSRLRGHASGLLAAVILMTAQQWLYMSRQAMLDVPLATMIAAAALALLAGRSRLAGLACGIALLIKGPLVLVAIAVALLARFVQRLRRKDGEHLPSSVPHARILSVVAIAFAVAAPWHLHQVLVHGHDFTDYYFGTNLGMRLMTGMEGHGGPWWYYLDRIFTYWFSPWHLLGALALLTYSTSELRGGRTGLRWILLWFFTPLVVLSLAQTKLHWYITPAYPPLAILTGSWLIELSRKLRWTTRVIAVLIALTLLQSGYYSFVFGTRSRTEDVRSILSRLPPPAIAPVLFVSSSIPHHAARFYARRTIRDRSPAAVPDSGWVLAHSNEREQFGPRPLLAAEGQRILLGPATSR